MAGTLVWMADGSLRPVERVRSGDWVMTRDPATGREGAAQAAVTTLRSAGSVVAVTLADAQTGQGETVTASPEHPFFVQGVGFVPACMLAVGNAVVTRAGPPLAVTRLETLSQPGGYAVYNFVVPGDHTYFVGTLGGGAWVHNPAPCDAAASLPQLKGKSVSAIGRILMRHGFTRTKISNSVARIETWKHADGSEVLIHPYGDETAKMFKTANNGHVHKHDPAGGDLNDRGFISSDPNETHIGIQNPADLPTIRGRPHGM